MTRTLAELDAKVDRLSQIVGAGLGVDPRTDDEIAQAAKDTAAAEKQARADAEKAAKA